MNRRGFIQSIAALFGAGVVAREALQPESRPEWVATPYGPAPVIGPNTIATPNGPLTFPDRPIVPTKTLVFDDSELHPLRFVKYEPPIGSEDRERLLEQFARIDSSGAYVVPSDGELATSRDGGVTWIKAAEDLEAGDLVTLDSNGRARKARG